jgi:two-component system LytT family response regulator
MSSKVIIIDDEPLARSIVIEYIQHFPDLVVSQVCSNGFEGIKAYSAIQARSYHSGYSNAKDQWI